MKIRNNLSHPQKLMTRICVFEISKRSFVQDIINERYTELKKRLLDVSHWKDFTNKDSAAFKLCCSNGREICKIPTNGDYVKVSLYWRSEGFEKFLWFQINEVGDDLNEDNELENYRIIISPSTPDINFGKDRRTKRYFLENSFEIRISRGKDFIKISLFVQNYDRKKDNRWLHAIKKIFWLSNSTEDLVKHELMILAAGLI